MIGLLRGHSSPSSPMTRLLEGTLEVISRGYLLLSLERPPVYVDPDTFDPPVLQHSIIHDSFELVRLRIPWPAAFVFVEASQNLVCILESVDLSMNPAVTVGCD